MTEQKTKSVTAIPNRANRMDPSRSRQAKGAVAQRFIRLLNTLIH
ncbi:MAG: hypothetical protein AB8B41_10235 [Prochlorococcus sp.]